MITKIIKSKILSFVSLFIKALLSTIAKYQSFSEINFFLNLFLILSKNLNETFLFFKITINMYIISNATQVPTIIPYIAGKETLLSKKFNHTSVNRLAICKIRMFPKLRICQHTTVGTMGL